MLRFNGKPYKKFSDVIESSSVYLKTIAQKSEFLETRKRIILEAKNYKRKDNRFLEKVWLKRTKQGIANTTNNGFHENEFLNNIDCLHDLTINIKNKNSHNSYLSAISALSLLKQNKKIKSIYKAQVARAFCAFYPDDFINWVSDEKIKKMLKIFTQFDDLNSSLRKVNEKDDWYTISSQMRAAINKINKSVKAPLSPEDIRLLISQIYLQNDEFSSSSFDKAVLKYRKKYEQNRDMAECPEGSAEPDIVYESNVARIIRCPKVKGWVLAQANGKCECCKKKAPFNGTDGLPYLEVHHMKHLSDKGGDTPSNTVAVCPNCHRAIHFSENKNELMEKIYNQVDRLARE